jgi:hypothetical protein
MSPCPRDESERRGPSIPHDVIDTWRGAHTSARFIEHEFASRPA